MKEKVKIRSVTGHTLRHDVLAILIAALALISIPVDASADEADDTMGATRLFASDGLLPVTIEAPLRTLMRERPDEAYLEGKFRFTDAGGADNVVDLKLRTRGNYRRQKDHCDFAPIRLNFRTRQLAGTEFEGQDKLKLVTHCLNRQPGFEQYILREYIAYRFLNTMTTRSFGVRLLEITYIDTEGARPMTKLGFVIEDEDDVATRNNMQIVRGGDISNEDLDPREQNFTHVFQYMIGNTEYSLIRAEPDKDCCHNADLMSVTGGPPLIPLAYDFDFAGLVNAPYAQPNPRYRLRSVRQRLYKGRCRNNALLPETIERFHDNRNTIYGIVDGLDLLDARSSRYVIRYLNAFYDHISKPEFVKARFADQCNDA